jgi:hypothetical protein
VQQQQQTQEQLFQLQQTQQQLIQQHQQLLQQQQLLLQQQEKQQQLTIQHSVHTDHVSAPGRSQADEAPRGHEMSSVQQAQAQAHLSADQRQDGRDTSRHMLQPHEQTLQHVINPKVQQAAHRPSPHLHYEPSIPVYNTCRRALLEQFVSFVCRALFHAWMPCFRSVS